MEWVDWVLSAMSQWDGMLKLFMLYVVIWAIGIIATLGEG